MYCNPLYIIIYILINNLILIKKFFFLFILKIISKKKKISKNIISILFIKWINYKFIKIYNINVNLRNKLMVIHPVILYYSWIFFFINFYIIFLKKFKIKNNLVYLSIFLGGYWAQQELSWGGW